MHGTACASAHRQPRSWINSLKSNFLYLIMMIPNYAKAVAMSFPRMTLNFVLLNHTHNLFWRCNSLHVKSMKYSLICLIVVRTMAHMDAVFFFNLAFSSTGGIKEKKGTVLEPCCLTLVRLRLFCCGPQMKRTLLDSCS